MLGKGLESLIPKKSDNVSPVSPSVPSILPPLNLENPTAPPPRLEPRPPFGPLRKISDGGSIFQIEVEKIAPNPYQPRRNFNEDDLRELAQSIQEFGIIQPLVVTKIEKETPTGRAVEYQLIAGERRLMAAKLLGLERVPAIVKHFDLNRAKLEVALVENIQRSNLNPIEAARGYARLQEEFGLTQKEIAARIGKSRETVANTIRLLGLPGPIQESLINNKINESQARLILAAENPVRQKELFENILSGSTRVSGEIRRVMPVIIDPEAQYYERRLEEYLGAPVEVRRRKGKGKMTVKFYSEAEWQNILGKLLGSDNE